MKFYFSLLLILMLFENAFNQDRTVGLVSKDVSFDERVFYTFSPVNGKSTYLVDNCGNLINQWTSDFFPGMTDYLTDDGSLYTARRLGGNPTMGSAGLGGVFQKFNWEGDLVWQYEISDSFTLAHHDFSIKPNGNLLIIAWDYKTEEEAIQAGRNPANVDQSIWSEKIMEIRPIGEDSAELVWEWYLWDHLIQNYDDTKDNFGNPNANKGKMNINNVGLVAKSWMHFNSIQYNPRLEQILFSSPSANEIFIIDNSTTSDQAATNSGGRWHKGGEFLFRFGTNATYTDNDTTQYLYFQHNAQWIENSLEGQEGITVFNNGRYRPLPNLQKPYSNVIKLVPALNETDTSYVEEDNGFQILQIDTLYNSESDTLFYAAVMSGATLLEDGLFIAHAPEGRFFELDINGNKRIEYIVPIDRSGDEIAQGTDISTLVGPLFNDNGNFKTVRYNADFSGFVGKDMSSIGTVETDPLPSLCEDTTEITAVDEKILNSIKLYPTLVVNNTIQLETINPINQLHLTLINTKGQTVFTTSEAQLMNGTVVLPDTIAKGIYWVRLQYSFEKETFNQSIKIAIF
jgi:hypothetical protein